MKKGLGIFLAALLTTNSAMASAMTWECQGAKSKLEGTSGFMSVQLHSATLTMEQETAEIDHTQKDYSSVLQKYDLPALTVLFIPQSNFERTESLGRAAKALVVVFRKGGKIALDTLACVGR